MLRFIIPKGINGYDKQLFGRTIGNPFLKREEGFSIIISIFVMEKVFLTAALLNAIYLRVAYYLGDE